MMRAESLHTLQPTSHTQLATQTLTPNHTNSHPLTLTQPHPLYHCPNNSGVQCPWSEFVRCWYLSRFFFNFFLLLGVCYLRENLAISLMSCLSLKISVNPKVDCISCFVSGLNFCLADMYRWHWVRMWNSSSTIRSKNGHSWRNPIVSLSSLVHCHISCW